MCPGPLPLYLGYLLLQLARVAWLPRGGARRELPLPLATAPTSPLHAPLSRAAAASLAFHHSGDDRLRYAGMLVRLWFSYGRTAVHLPPGSQFTSPAQPRSSTKLPCPVREGALLMEFAIMAVQLVDGVVRFSAWGRAVRRPWTCSSFLGVPRFQNCSVVRRPVDVQFGAPVVVLLNMAQKFILFSE